MDRRHFLIGAAASSLVAVPGVSLAGSCAKRTLATCDGQDPWGHKHGGTKQMSLPYCGKVRHPDFHLLDPQWYSFATLANEGQVEDAVQRLRNGKQWYDVVELPLGQSTGDRCYKPGWVILIVSPCRYPGHNVVMVTNPLGPADNGKVFSFRELRSNGKTVLV